MSKARESLERARTEIENAPEGQRNETLNAQAFVLGKWIGAGWLDRGEVERALMDAAIAAGLLKVDARATIESGLKAGERDPIRPGKGRSGRRRPEGRIDMEAEHEHGPDPDHESEPNPAGLFVGTRWPSRFKPQSGKPFEMTFDEMVEQAEKAQAAKGNSGDDKGALPQWNLAQFKDNYRNLDNFEAAHGLVLDVDEGDWTREDIERAFGRWTFVAHTTWSHKPGAARWRVLLPLARTVSEAEHRRLMTWAKLKFPGVDKADSSKGFFLPVKRPGYQTMKHKGEPLNPDAWLAELDRMKADAVLEPLAVGNLIDTEIATIERRVNGTEKPIPTPWPRVNELMSGGLQEGGGLWPGLTILVGATGAGKTQWALQCAHYAADNGTPVLYIGLELDSLGFVCRLMGMRSKVQWSDLYYGHKNCHLLSGDDSKDPLEVIVEQGDALYGLPLLFEPGSTVQWNPNELKTLCRAMRDRHPGKPFLVVLDFLQLVGGDLKAPLRERIGYAAYMGRGVARDYGASVILISSIARDNYAKLTGKDSQGNQKRGQALGEGHPGRLVGLGKESGEIEHAADAVLVLGSNEAGDIDSPGPRGIFLAVAKVRAGLPNWGGFHFDGTEFTEVDYKDLLVEEGKKAMRAGRDKRVNGGEPGKETEIPEPTFKPR